MLRLWEYFGLVGTLSVLLWVAALVVLVVFFRRPRRTVAYGAALIAVVLALFLGEINSRAVSNIRVDRTAEEEAMRERQRQVRQAEYDRLRQSAAGVRFAEDAPGDELDPAGLRSERQMSVYERAARGVEEPAYRQRGPQERVVDGEARGRIAEQEERADTGDGFEGGRVRMLEEAAVLQANRWDQLNRFMLKLMFLATLGMFGYDYFVRFNRPREVYCPLPLSGPWVDRIFPKNSVCWVDSADNGLAEARAYAESVVRKGETFCLIGPEDPWPEEGHLLRWPPVVKKLAWSGAALPKQTLSLGQEEIDPEYLFENLWFGRGCFVLRSRAASLAEAGGMKDPVLQSMEEFLQYRYRSRGLARQTVHFIFLEADKLDTQTLAKWERLLSATNGKLVLQGARGEFREAFPDETFGPLEEEERSEV
ncbi:MAG: hypothetical protein LAT55_09010 [Opitutales bacterium]|nr:hypothetical protein [Opitutales bacterium]